MRALQTMHPMLRAVGVIGTVAALVTATTFAALSSTATLSANTLSTATAGLNIAKGDVDATDNTDPGFTFNNLTTGEASAPQVFNLKNTGGVPLQLSVNIPSVPSTGIADANKLVFCFNEIDNPAAPGPESCFTLNQLVNNPTNNLNGLLPNNNDNTLYEVTAEVQDGFSQSSGATIPTFDFVFTGTEA